jgi:hypothetical protein
MVDQSSMNGRQTARGQNAGSRELEGVAEFVDDVASLAELQATLAVIDVRENARKAVVPIVLTGLSLAVLVASVPVALLGAGWLLASALKIHQGWAMLMTAGTAIAVAGLGAGLGGIQLRHGFDGFRRSRKQLRLNLAWIRTVLVTSASVRTHARRRS